MGYGETAEYGTLDYKQDEIVVDEVGPHFQAMVQIWPVQELLEAEE